MAKQEWGEKRTCQSCGKNFYDMMRFPIACPECGAAFTVVEPVARRGSTGARGKFFVAKREPEEDALFDSRTVAEESADEAEDGEREDDGDAGENGEDGEPVSDGDESDAVGEDKVA
ncbi:TIGR02300 family protein [Telmatospirillum siberiense]|uniref:TIGR02300 family protein n=2 Tax=Telmatospirillum siberiense TaxID=382514 RepID=A0A2N3PQH1_9PROT|nr:TIGR02300 family protein [Telmatospirillum siberiense]